MKTFGKLSHENILNLTNPPSDPRISKLKKNRSTNKNEQLLKINIILKYDCFTIDNPHMRTESRVRVRRLEEYLIKYRNEIPRAKQKAAAGQKYSDFLNYRSRA